MSYLLQEASLLSDRGSFNGSRLAMAAITETDCPTRLI